MRIFYLAGFIIFLASCHFPEDPNHSLQDIRTQHILKLGLCRGLSQNPNNEKAMQLVEAIAQSLQAKIVSIEETQENLYRALQENQINLVICEIHEDSPWQNKLGFTAPYLEERNSKNKIIKYVMAIPAGENAWLKYINEFIFKGKHTP